MHTSSCAERTKLRMAALAVAISVAAGCGIEKQEAPNLAGPSEFGLSITLTATPDSIVQDGASQSVIQVLARGADGRPAPNVMVKLSATSSDGSIRAVTFTADTVVTDSNGQATVGLIAPPPPATVPTTPPILYVTATPVGSDYSSILPRQIQVRLLAPAGTPLPNLEPDAVILADPRVANYNETIRFDGSLTTDEGQACGSRCTYIWEFGDNTVAVKGITAEHVYPLPGTYTVTLTVTDDRGGVDTASVDIRIIGPSAPTADFTVTPSTLTVGANGTFNASTSTVGGGATITQYAWDFGDGSPTVTTSSATTTKSYASAGSKVVTLTVTDSLGRTATKSATVTVQ